MPVQLSEQDLTEAFDLFDADGSGKISADELRFALQSLGMRDVTARDVDQIMRAVDSDRSGTIERGEFVHVVRGPAPRGGSVAADGKPNTG
eukprot:gene46205-16297_t